MFVMLVTGDRLGKGDDELGAILMRNFIYSVARSQERPDVLAVMNGGVRLACEGSESLEDLRLLVQEGVEVKACGTCLDYLGLKDSLAVGVIGTMAETVAGIGAADKVVVVG